MRQSSSAFSPSAAIEYRPTAINILGYAEERHLKVIPIVVAKMTTGANDASLAKLIAIQRIGQDSLAPSGVSSMNIDPALNVIVNVSKKHVNLAED